MKRSRHRRVRAMFFICYLKVPRCPLNSYKLTSGIRDLPSKKKKKAQHVSFFKSFKKFSSPKISRRLVDRASTCAAGHHCASIGQGEVRRRAVLERCSLLRGWAAWPSFHLKWSLIIRGEVFERFIIICTLNKIWVRKVCCELGLYYSLKLWLRN